MFAHKTSWSDSRYPLQTTELNKKGKEKTSLLEERRNQSIENQIHPKQTRKFCQNYN